MRLPSLFDVFFRPHQYTVVQQHAVELSVRALLSHSWIEEWRVNVSLKWIKMIHLKQLMSLSSLADTDQYVQALLANKSTIYILILDINTYKYIVGSVKLILAMLAIPSQTYENK